MKQLLKYRSLFNIRPKNTQIKIRNYATTWSSLAVDFNHKPKKKMNLFNNETGLFNKPELSSFEGFYALKEEVINRSEALVEEVSSPNRTRPTVEILDDLSNTLCKIADLSEFIRIAHPLAKYRYAAEDVCISIGGIVEKLNTNRDLYDALSISLKNGTAGDEYVANLFLFDFEQSGINLPDIPRERVVNLNNIILQMGQRFMAGALDYRPVPRDSVSEDIANQFGGKGNLLANGLVIESSTELLREAHYRVYLAPDSSQDHYLTTLLSARQEMAQICGFPSYGERAIKASLMETASNVDSFLNKLAENLRPRAAQDFDKMIKMKKTSTSPTTIDKISCWDVPYFTNKGRLEWLKGSSVDYSPYFSLGGCMEGFNTLLQSLYGISLRHEEMLPGESWSSDVYKLAVIDEKEGLLGYIYCDFYERFNKPNQDCHFTIQGGKLLPDGTYQLPIVVIMLSLNCGNWGAPALLSPGSVENLFHELGHAIHSMVGRTTYQHVSGTRCPTDLAEVPSVLMEYFASSPKVLRMFARHFQTQEPMPEDMIHRLCSSKHLFGASDMQQQLFYSALDQQYHSKYPFGNESSSTAILKQIQEKYYGLPYVENTAWQHRFGHLFGYGAKYYSYLISRALAWSCWHTYFMEDPLSRSAGDKLRYELLCHGGALPCQSLVDRLLSPMQVTPDSLANALSEELDFHQDSFERMSKIKQGV